jgi:hypothetical protein
MKFEGTEKFLEQKTFWKNRPNILNIECSYGTMDKEGVPSAFDDQ